MTPAELATGLLAFNSIPVFLPQFLPYDRTDEHDQVQGQVQGKQHWVFLGGKLFVSREWWQELKKHEQ